MKNRITQFVFLIFSIGFVPIYCYSVFLICQKKSPETLGDVLWNSMNLNLLAMTTFSFLNEAFQLYTFVPEKYYTHLTPKQIDQLYHFLKVEWFKKIVTIIPLKRMRPRPSHERIWNEIERTKKSEISHTLPVLILFATCLFFLVQQKIFLVTMILFLNFFFNIQPILLQRKNRMRYQRHLHKYLT